MAESMGVLRGPCWAGRPWAASCHLHLLGSPPLHCLSLILCGHHWLLFWHGACVERSLLQEASGSSSSWRASVSPVNEAKQDSLGSQPGLPYHKL
jgi:hypothetical protein